MVSMDCGFVVIGIGGHTMLYFEEIIGVSIDVRFRRSSKAYHNSVEILENGAVLLENTAVAFVDDDKVKMCRGKKPPAIWIPCRIDSVKHCRICRENNASIAILFVGKQVAQRHVRQVILEVIASLLNQCCTVGQEKNIRHMTTTGQYIDQAGCGSSLTCTSSHDEQVLTETVHDVIADCTDGFFLVIAVGNLIVDNNSIKILPLAAPGHELLQSILTEKTTYLALRGGLVIPKVCLEAVCREHHGAAAKPLLQTVRIQHCLLTSDIRVFA